MRDYKEEQEGKSNNNKSRNEQAAEIKRLLGQFHSFAIDAKRVAEAMQHNAGLRRDVREGLEPKLLAMLQEATACRSSRLSLGALEKPKVRRWRHGQAHGGRRLVG